MALKNDEIVVENVENDSIIDVVERFDYSTQSDKYNDKFKKWRKNTKNPYAFNFKANSKEKIFADGRGFIQQDPKKAEEECFSRILYCIGIAILQYIFIENVISKIVIEIFDFFGINIHNSLSNQTVYGGHTEVMIFLVIVSVLKYIVPIIYLLKKVKLPAKVVFPNRLKSNKELFFGLSVSFIICVLTSFARGYVNSIEEIYSFFNNYNTDISVFDKNELMLYIFFDVIVISILIEILFSGVIFPLVRQFGDLFAVALVSFFSSIVTEDVSIIVQMYCISFVSLTMFLRSHSILTCIFIRITSRMYLFTLALIELNEQSNSSSQKIVFMGFFFCVGLLILNWSVRRCDKKPVLLCNAKSFLPVTYKCHLVLRNMTTFVLVVYTIAIICIELLL